MCYMKQNHIFKERGKGRVYVPQDLEDKKGSHGMVAEIDLRCFTEEESHTISSNKSESCMEKLSNSLKTGIRTPLEELKKTTKVINLGFDYVRKHLPPREIIEKYRTLDYFKIDSDAVKVAKHFNESYEEYSDYEKYFKSIVKELSQNVGRFIERSKQNSKSTELFVVRAIFRFVCEFLEYKDEKNSKFTTMIIDSKKSMCEGFSDMFVKLCDKAKIFAIKIHGSSKDFNGNVSENTGHCWNAVFIGNCFFPLDATWSWGTKKKNFDDFWFLSHPEDFILTHLPDSNHPQLQFLPTLITESQWRRSIFIPIEAQREGIGVLSHVHKEIVFFEEEGKEESKDKAGAKVVAKAKIELKNTKGYQLVTELLSVVDSKITNQRMIRKFSHENERFVLCQNIEKKTIIEMYFPKKNQDYILKIYKRNLFFNPLKNTCKHTYLFQYEIKNETVEKRLFPLLTQFHRKRKCFLVSPQEGELVIGRVYDIEILVPNAIDVVLNEGTHIKFTTPLYKRSQREDIFYGKIEFNRMKTKCEIITIFAHFQSMHEDDWMPVAIYNVNWDKK